MIKTPPAGAADDHDWTPTLLDFLNIGLTVGEEDVLRRCTLVLKASKPSTIAYALAATVIHVRGLNRLVPFPDYMRQFGVKKEAAYRKVRLGKLYYAFWAKHRSAIVQTPGASGPPLLPANLRPPATEREARPFTSRKYTVAQQLEGWEVALREHGGKKIKKEVADAIMARIAPPTRVSAPRKNQAATLRVTISDLEAEVAKLTAAVNTLTGESGFLKAEIAQREAQNKTLSAQLAAHRVDSKAEAVKAVAEKQALKTELEHRAAEADAQKVEIGRLTRQLDTVQEAAENIRALSQKRAQWPRRFKYGALCSSQVTAGSLSVYLASQPDCNALALGTLAVTGCLVWASRIAYPEMLKRLPLLRVPCSLPI